MKLEEEPFFKLSWSGTFKDAQTSEDYLESETKTSSALDQFKTTKKVQEGLMTFSCVARLCKCRVERCIFIMLHQKNCMCDTEDLDHVITSST